MTPCFWPATDQIWSSGPRAIGVSLDPLPIELDSGRAVSRRCLRAKSGQNKSPVHRWRRQSETTSWKIGSRLASRPECPISYPNRTCLKRPCRAWLGRPRVMFVGSLKWGARWPSGRVRHREVVLLAWETTSWQKVVQAQLTCFCLPHL
jgi:hypothetical protein